jgi:hypothetical protein
VADAQLPLPSRLRRLLWAVGEHETARIAAPPDRFRSACDEVPRDVALSPNELVVYPPPKYDRRLYPPLLVINPPPGRLCTHHCYIDPRRGRARPHPR